MTKAVINGNNLLVLTGPGGNLQPVRNLSAIEIGIICKPA